jgi:hypothetical protein
VLRARRLGRDGANDRFSVEDDRYHSLLQPVRVPHLDPVVGSAPALSDLEALPGGGDAGVDDESCETGPNAEDPVGGGVVGPAGAVGEAFPTTRAVSVHH